MIALFSGRSYNSCIGAFNGLMCENLDLMNWRSVRIKTGEQLKM